VFLAGIDALNQGEQAQNGQDFTRLVQSGDWGMFAGEGKAY